MPAQLSRVRVLIESKEGPRSVDRVGKSIGVGQLNRVIREAIEKGRLPEWSVCDALAERIDVALIDVVAAFALDAGIDLLPGVQGAGNAAWDRAQIDAAQKVADFEPGEERREFVRAIYSYAEVRLAELRASRKRGPKT